MKDLFATMRSRSVSSVVVILTLAALCFSVGEGLRLRPFPTPQSLDPTNRSSVDPSRVSVFKSGPLDVPAQTQKRSKRFAIDLAAPVSHYSYKPVTCLHALSVQDTLDVASISLVAFPSDRAPPFTT